jgi:hypothetical protein
MLESRLAVVFDLGDGLLKDLKVDFEAELANVQKIYCLSPGSNLVLLVALLDSRGFDDIPTGFHHIEFNQSIVSRVLLPMAPEHP